MNNTTNEYLLDTNVLIQAHKDYYATDLVSTFWTYLAVSPTINSIDKVKNEIDKKNEFLFNWARNDFKHWESTENKKTAEQYLRLITWSNTHKQFADYAKEEFKSQNKADAWLVAHALATKRVVVTDEKFNIDIKKRIPIPNVCKEFGVRYINTFDMLRELQIKLA